MTENQESTDSSSSEGFMMKKITRRQALGTAGKIAVGAVAVAAVGAAYGLYATRPAPGPSSSSISSSSSSTGFPSIYSSPTGKQIYYSIWTGDFAAWENNALAEWAALPVGKYYPMARVGIASPNDIFTALKSGVPIDSGQYYAGTELCDAVRQGLIETWDPSKYPYGEVPGMTVQDPWMNNNGSPAGSGTPSDVLPPQNAWWSGGEAITAATKKQPYFNFYGTQVAAIPFNVTPWPFYMNTSIFQRVGADLPTTDLSKPYTWDSLWPALQKITQKLAPTTYGLSLGAAVEATITQYTFWIPGYEFLQILWGFGGDWAIEGKDPWTFKSGFNSDAAVSAFKVYNDAYNTYKVVPPDCPTWARNEPYYGNQVVSVATECSCMWEIIATMGNPTKIEPIIRATKTLPYPTTKSTPEAVWEVNAQTMFKSGGHLDAAWAWSQVLMSNMENIWQWAWRQPAPGGARAQELQLIAQIPGMVPLITKYGLDTSWFMADVLKLEQPPYARMRTRCPLGPTWPQFAQDLSNVIRQKMTPAEAAADYDGKLNAWLKSQTTPSGASMYSSA